METKNWLILDENGFILGVTLEPKEREIVTDVFPIDMVKPRLIDGVWVETNIYSTTQIIAMEIEKKKAINAQRRQDGIEAYEKVASEMDAYVELGIVTQAQFDYISETMKPVRTEIVMGRWTEGLDILITLEAKLDIKTYNKFYKIITDYLAQ
jgi:hypothetical protein